MMRLDAKDILAISAVSAAIALNVGLFVLIMQGKFHWSQILVFGATAVVTFGVTALLWMIFARRVRAERVHGTKLILRELVKRDAGLKKEMTSLRGGIDSVRERSVGLDERQRKVLNVVRSESQASRERLAEMVANQRNLWEGLDGEIGRA